MFVRMTNVTLKPDRVDEANQLWRDEILALIRQQRGFRGVMNFGDRTTGRGTTLTFWDSEEDLRASANSGFRQEVVDKFADMFAQPSDPPQSFEVFLDERS